MEQVSLGRTGMRVGHLGIGTAYGLDAHGIQSAVERGANFLFWGSYRRSSIPKALKTLGPARRGEMVIAAGCYGHRLFHHPWLARQSVERALRRLETDYLDLLLLAYVSSQPSDAMMQELARLKERGLVRHLGISTHDHELASRLLAVADLEVFMVRYNAANRKAERLFFPHVDPSRHAVIAFTTTRWGQLLRAPRGWPADKPVPTAVDCYRFALTHPKVTICLSGVKNEQQLGENLAGIEAGPMTDEELAWMREFGDVVYENVHAALDRSKRSTG